MSDLISRNALLADIEATIENSGCVNHEGEILDCIAYADEIDAVPVVRGEWVFENDYYSSCTACNKWVPIDHDDEWRHCPNCGAKMEDKPCE